MGPYLQPLSNQENLSDPEFFATLQQTGYPGPARKEKKAMSGYKDTALVSRLHFGQIQLILLASRSVGGSVGGLVGVGG